MVIVKKKKKKYQLLLKIPYTEKEKNDPHKMIVKNNIWP